jgi:C-terminal processing protease CtpA/Prc
VPTYGNNFNNPAGSKLVPSITNVLLGFRTAIARPQTASPAQQLHTESSTAQRLAPGILGVRIPCISLRCDRWLERLLLRLQASHIRGLVLDLRDNPGGSVVAAQKMAAVLLHSNFAIAITTDAQTASAAELLAASLQGRANTRLFGDTTYGKTTASYHWCSETWLQANDGACTTMRRLDQRELDPRGVRPEVFTEPLDTIAQAVQWLQRKLS